MRNSRGSSQAGVLALALGLAAGVAAADVSAHRRDEYLQAARIAIDPGRVHVELDLTPGIALAETILVEIDRNRDGSLSAEEQRTYGSVVLGALTLEVDGTLLRPRLDASSFPEVDAVRRGEGIIRLHLTATLPRLSGGFHQLLFRNRHRPDRSVYLANALVPESRLVSVTAQRRDVDQTELTIDFLVRAAPERPASPWLLGGLVAATALSTLLIRFLSEGRRPSDSPTRSLARRFAGALRSRGSLAAARSRDGDGRSMKQLVVLVGCATTTLAVVLTAGTAAQARLAALPAAPKTPADNPSTPERVALGRLLFWDPILSGQKDVACATCHHPAFGYSDGLDLSIGANGAGLGPARTFAAGHAPRPVKRNSQTVLNTAFNGLTIGGDATPAGAPMFWDLRVRSLEAQALEPLKALDEMRGSEYPEDRALPAVVSRLNAIPEYRRLFARAFDGAAPVNERNLGRALAAFQRTLVAANTPFDRYMRGDTTALSPEQLRGMEQFQSVGCVNCHNGPMFSDFEPHVLAVPDNAKLPEPDSGVSQTYAFRTPSLRNLGVTAPYMHSGVFATLQDVVNFYQRVSGGGGRRGGGGGRGLNPQVTRDQIDPLARQLNMRGRGQRELIEFLRALDDPGFDRTVPARVPSGLHVGGRLER